MIILRQNVLGDAGKFASKNDMQFEISDNKRSITFSGIATIDFFSPGGPWKEEEIELFLDIPGIPSGRSFIVEQKNLLISPVSIYKQGSTTQSGFSINEFSFGNLSIGAGLRQVQVRIKAAIAGENSKLFKIAYQVSLIGRIINN